MQAIHVIKEACSEALNEDNPAGLDRFRNAVDPASVLELASMLESLLTYLDDIDDLTARELVRETRHRLKGDSAEGGV